MCDYSLCGLPNRLAIEGETLEVHRFSTGSMGLASYTELHPKPAVAPPLGFWPRLKASFREMWSTDQATVVCMPPGAYLILRGIPPHLKTKYAVSEVEGVKFTQICAASSTHRDCVQFSNGATAGLQELPQGLEVEVLSLTPLFSDDEQTFSTANTAAVRLRRS